MKQKSRGGSWLPRSVASGSGRPDRALLPRIEGLELRVTPTTLPTGFTESAVVSGLSRADGDGIRARRPPVRARAGGQRQARPRRRHDLDRPAPLNATRAASAACSASPSTPPSRRTISSTCTTPTPIPGAVSWATGVHNQLSRFTVNDSNPQQPIFTNEAPILDWNNLERGHQPQRRRDPLRPRRHALRRRRRQRADLHPGGEHLPGLADPLQPPGQAAPHRRLRVQPGRRDARRHHGRAPDPGRQPVRGDGHGDQPAHLRARPAQPVHLRGAARHGDDLHQRRGRDRPGRRSTRASPAPTTAGAAATPTGSARLRRARAPTTTRCSPTTTREARPAAASPSSGAPSTTRPRRSSPAATSASTSTRDLGGGWIRVFDPPIRAPPPTPTRPAFATGTAGQPARPQGRFGRQPLLPLRQRRRDQQDLVLALAGRRGVRAGGGGGRPVPVPARPARPGPSPAAPASRPTAAASPPATRRRPQGAQVAFLQGTGSFSQAVAGWAAGSYALTFHAAQRGNYQASRQDFQVLVDGVVVGTFTPAGHVVPDATRPPRSPSPPGRTRSRSRAWTPPAATTPPSSTTSRSPSAGRAAESPTPGSSRSAGGRRPVPVPPGRLGLDLRRRRRRRGQRQRLHRRQPAGPGGRPGRLPPGDRLVQPGGRRLGRRLLRAHLPRRPAGQLPGVAAGLPGPGRRRRGGHLHARRHVVPDLHDRRVHASPPGRTRSPSRAWTAPAATTPPSSTTSPSRRPACADGRRRGVRAGGGGGRPVPVPPGRLALDLRRRRRHRGQRQRLHRRQPAGPGGRPGRLPPEHRLVQPGGRRLGRRLLRAHLLRRPAGQLPGVAAGLPGPGRRRRGRHLHALRDVVPGATRPPRSPSPPGRTRSPSRAWTAPAATTPPSSTRSQRQHPVARPTADRRRRGFRAGGGGCRPVPVPARPARPGPSPATPGISGNGSGFTAGNPPAPQGAQVAFLQSTGSFSQAVAGWAAGSYLLTFRAAQRGNFRASRQDFRVLVDGVVVGTFTPSGTSYQPYTTAAFTVAAGSHTITFQGLDSAGGDNTAFDRSDFRCRGLSVPTWPRFDRGGSSWHMSAFWWDPGSREARPPGEERDLGRRGGRPCRYVSLTPTS